MVSKITADPPSTVFSKSAYPLDLPHKFTIRALFKAKSVNPKTYSLPSLSYKSYNRTVPGALRCEREVPVMQALQKDQFSILQEVFSGKVPKLSSYSL